MSNAASAKDVKKAEKQERRTRLQELADLSFVLNTSKGRRFYWRLMEFCETMRLSYTRGDTHETAFRQGMANVGHRLLADLMDCDGEIYRLMREENIEEVDDARTSSSGETGGTGEDGIG